MPNLRYQYIMNEPFIGGVNDTVQSSHEANIHKRRVAYDLAIEEEAREETMPMAERKQRMLTDLVSHIEKDRRVQRQDLTAQDAHTLLITQGNEELFGLTILEKKSEQLTLVEFEVERALDLNQFFYMVNREDLKSESPQEISADTLNFMRKMLQDNYLVKLKVLDKESAEDNDMMDASLAEEQR